MRRRKSSPLNDELWLQLYTTLLFSFGIQFEGYIIDLVVFPSVRFENTALTLGELRELIAAEVALYGHSKKTPCGSIGSDVESLSQELQSKLSLQASSEP